MTRRTTALCALAAALLSISSTSATVALSDAINHHLSTAACQRSTDLLCARS